MLSLLTGTSNDPTRPARKWPLTGLKPPRRDFLLVTGFFFGLSLLLTWPLALNIGEAVPGPSHQDQYQNLWNLWWAKFSLFNLHTNPFHSDYLLYPYGADLYLHTLDLANGLLSVPFRVFGLVFAYNAILLVGLVLTGLATYYFSLELGLTWPGALMAGVLMVFSPVHLRYLKGEIEFVNFGWFIFYLLLLLKLEKFSQGLKWPFIISGGVLIAVTGYTSAYQLIWLAIINFFWFIKEFWTRRTGPKGWVWNWLAGWGLGAVLLSPWLLGALLEFSSGKVHTEESLDYLNGAGVSLDSFVVPHYYNPWLTNNPAFNFLTNGSDLSNDNFFLGFVLLILAGTGLYFYIRQKAKIKLLFWLLVGLVFGILSLGPELYFGRTGTGIPLPYRLFLELPFSRIVRNSARFSELLLFGLALLAGFGFQQLLSRSRLARLKYGSAALTIFIGLVILLEFWKLPYQNNKIEIPAAYYNLQGSGAVLELPLNEHDISDAPAMAYQTVHNRQILPAYLSRRLESPYELPNSPLNLLVFRSNKPDIFNVSPADNALNILRILGAGSIVFHRDQEKSAAAQETFLAEIVKTQPYYKDPKTNLYAVPAGPAGPAFVIGTGWYDTEKDQNNQVARWTQQVADFDIYSDRPGPATLDFKAVAFAQNHTIKILLNGRETETIVVPTELTDFQIKINLQPGRNQLVLSGQEPALSPRQAGQGSDSRLLNIQVRQVSLAYS